MAQTTMFTQATSHDNAIVSDKHSELASTAHSTDQRKQNVVYTLESKQLPYVECLIVLNGWFSSSAYHELIRNEFILYFF